MNHLKFTHDKLNIEELSELATSPTSGATSVFVGTTRDNFEGLQVRQLNYEVYESMAIKALDGVCDEIRTKWSDVENIVIYHRLGVVPVKEASIVIAISSPHRKDAIKATEWCIDSVKKNVPIWKKEVYEGNNEPQWKENKECSWSKHVETSSRKRKLFQVDLAPKTYIPSTTPNFTQVKAPLSEVKNRIIKFMEVKKTETNRNNIKEFITPDQDPEFSCARIDFHWGRKKRHIQVKHILNTFHRDQFNSEYMLKHISKESIEERLQNLEVQLKLPLPYSPHIFERFRNLEDRLMQLEATSPEYINFWDTREVTQEKVKKPRKYTCEDIDIMMANLERRLNRKNKNG